MSVSSTPEGASVAPRHIHFDVSEDLEFLQVHLPEHL